MNRKIAFTLLLGFITSYTQGLTPFQFLPPFKSANVAASTAISLVTLGYSKSFKPILKRMLNTNQYDNIKSTLFPKTYINTYEFLPKKISAPLNNHKTIWELVAHSTALLQVFLPAYFILGHLVFKSNDPKAEFEKIKRALHKLQAHVQEATFEENGLEDSPEKEIKKIFPDAKDKEAIEKALLKTLKRIHSMEKALNALTTEKFTESSELTDMQKKLTHLKLYFEALQNTLQLTVPS